MAPAALDDDNEALDRINAVRARRAKEAEVVDLDAVDITLLQAWVRHKLGVNRGEDRPYHGVTGPFDALLDVRLAGTKKG